jgi:hypothetical protein
METAFTPWASLGGGALIGLAAVLLMALHGRILGATGILGGLLRFNDPADWSLRAAIVAGMATGPLAWLLVRRASGHRSAGAELGRRPWRADRRGRGQLRRRLHLGARGLRHRPLLAPVAGGHRHLHGTAIATVFVIRHVMGGW